MYALRLEKYFDSHRRNIEKEPKLFVLTAKFETSDSGIRFQIQKTDRIVHMSAIGKSLSQSNSRQV